LITVFDFIDLVNALGMEKTIEATCFEAQPLDLNYTINKHSTFPFLFDNPQHKGFMYSFALKRVDSELFPGTQKCFFLHEEKRPEPFENPELPAHRFHPGSKIAGRCLIYEHRPNVCMNYPIAFNPHTWTSQLRRRENLPQASIYEGYQICPKQVLSLNDFGINDPASIMKSNDNLLLGDARVQAHNHIAMRWNLQADRLIENIVPYIIQSTNSSITEFIPAAQPVVKMPQKAAREELPRMDGALNTLKNRINPS